MNEPAKKRFFTSDRLWGLVWLLAVTALSLAMAYNRTVTCSYVSINGDFQSYNVFRRLLAGQHAFSDFSNYIGMAPVLVNLPAVALAGGTFRASLFVTTFTTNLLFSVAVYLLLRLTSRSRPFAMLVSCATTKIVSSQLLYVLLGQKYGALATERCTGLYTPSNSMRMARCFLPFLFVLAALLYRRLHRGGRPLTELFASPVACAVVGGLLGLALVWSNDYSLACLLVFTVLLLLLQLFWYRQGFLHFLGCFGAYLGAFVAGAALSLTLVTGGRPGAWLASFFSTGKSQYYYFNGTGCTPVLTYFFTCKDFWLSAAPFLLFLVLFTVRLILRRLTEEELLLYFLTACLLAGTAAYILSGSGYNFREALEVFTVFFLLGWAVRGFRALVCRREKPRKVLCFLERGALCLFAAFFVFQGARGIAGHAGTPQGSYIPALDGFNTDTKALTDAAALTEGETVFSVYATGLEVVKGQFQPTGYDYIIHVLGDEARQAYIEDFTAGRYRYAQTPSLPVDGWVTLENWYFYRELYAHYTRVFKTEYSWVWQYAGDRRLTAQAEVTVNENADGSYTITCTSNETDDWIADIELCYSTRFTSPKAALLNLGRRAVFVQTGSLYADSTLYSGLSLPGDGCRHIPVVMSGGAGQAVIQSQFTPGVVFTSLSARFCEGLPRYTLHNS